MPISKASFHYEGNSGTSDDAGVIQLKNKDITSVKLSHIAYGEWVLSGRALSDALKTGITYRKSSSVNLYPVSIISVHNQENTYGELNLNFEDKMAHDAGDLLSQDPSISSIRKSGGYGFDPVMRGFKLSDNQQIKLSGLKNTAQDAEFAALPMDLRRDGTWMLSAQNNINFTSRNLQSWSTSIFSSLVDHIMDNYQKNIDPRTVNAATNANT
ncbi:MAG: hypothetical protein PF450_05150, partial [Bacteroidales bacterium]|nr:hypothetical protein [Bacteroidales bacterium]